MSPIPYLWIALIFPIGQDIMIESDDETCFYYAIDVIKSTEEFLSFAGQADIIKTDFRSDPTRFKIWVDIKSNVKTKDFIRPLAIKIATKLETEGLKCEINIDAGEGRETFFVNKLM